MSKVRSNTKRSVSPNYHTNNKNANPSRDDREDMRSSVFSRLGQKRRIENINEDERKQHKYKKTHESQNEQTNTDEIQHKRPRLVTSSQDGRSKRLFGALMGHLGRAKKQLENDSTLLEKQNTRKQDAEEHFLLNQKKEQAIHTYKTTLRRYEREKNDGKSHVERKYTQILARKKAQANFLATTSSPVIFYLPKHHTSETKVMLQASLDRYETFEKITQLQLQKEVEDIVREYQDKITQLTKEFEKTGEDMADQTNNKKDIKILDNSEISMEKDEIKDLDENIEMNEMVDEKTDEIEVVKDMNSDNESNNDQQEENSDISAHNSPRGQASSQEIENPQEDNITNSSPTFGKKEVNLQDQQESTETDQLYADKNLNISNNDSIMQDKEDTVKSESTLLQVDISKLRVKDLREELAKRNLDTSGLKAVLVKRLKEALAI